MRTSVKIGTAGSTLGKELRSSLMVMTPVCHSTWRAALFRAVVTIHN
ncbi:hypothetical protein [Xanthomonas hortorum]|nr:hypothetical protein [Xanthomonas hortorum]MDV2452795.1 hypothetical protein [Xanthomonas hortorum NBC5720]